MCRSVRHTPQAMTRRSTYPGFISGRGTSSKSRKEPLRDGDGGKTAALINTLHTERKGHVVSQVSEARPGAPTALMVTKSNSHGHPSMQSSPCACCQQGETLLARFAGESLQFAVSARRSRCGLEHSEAGREGPLATSGTFRLSQRQLELGSGGSGSGQRQVDSAVCEKRSDASA